MPKNESELYFSLIFILLVISMYSFVSLTSPDILTICVRDDARAPLLFKQEEKRGIGPFGGRLTS